MDKNEKIKIDIKIQPLKDGAHLQAGSFDNGGRWYPNEKMIVPGSFQVRSPSRAWPKSYLKHFYSRKYSQLLFYQKPLTWMYIQEIDPNSEDGKKIIAYYASLRLKGTLRRLHNDN